MSLTSFTRVSLGNKPFSSACYHTGGYSYQGSYQYY